MGQVLSNIIRCICGGVEETEWQSEQNPHISPSLLDCCNDSSMDLSSNSIVALHKFMVIDSSIHVEEDRRLVSLPLQDLDTRELTEGEEEVKEEQDEERLSNGVVISERRIQHYCWSHKILLVGEGNFSFSASLACAFGSATNMVATSLDSIGFLCRNYRSAMSNIHKLRSRGCKVFHGFDATEMAKNSLLNGMVFDRIIFNFPLAGFFPNETSDSQKCRHQLLVLLFLENAREMLSECGEIHVTHKSWGFFLQWNLELLASLVGLQLIEEVPFNFNDYPGYRTKYGFGGDKNFNCNPSKTYKFGLVVQHECAT